MNLPFRFYQYLTGAFKTKMISTKVLTLTVAIAVLWGRVSSYASSERARLTEGKAAEISFQFDLQPDVDIQIRIGNRRPLYRFGAVQEAGLSESQKERFKVRVVRDELHHSIHVHLIISSVFREDEGTFICDLLRNEEVLLEYSKRIGVSVDFPPGRASCHQEYHHIDHSNLDWALMICSAPVGSEPGFIECYQDGERRPPLERPTQNETTMTQIIWMKNFVPIYCCASAFDKPKGMCQCDDFLWDPITQSRIIDHVDPCPTHETIQQSKERQSNSKSTTTANSAPATDESNPLPDNSRMEDVVEHCSLSAMNVLVALILTFQVITLITLLTFIMFIRKIKIIKALSGETNEGVEQDMETAPSAPSNGDAVRKRKSFKNSKKSYSFPEHKK